MNTRPLWRKAALSSFLLLVTLPGFAQHVVVSTVRMPAAALGAATIGARLTPALPSLGSTLSGSLQSPALAPSWAPQVQAPGLAPSLIPQVQAPTLAPTVAAQPRVTAPAAVMSNAKAMAMSRNWVSNAQGILVPNGHASAMGVSVELGKSLSIRDIPASQVLSTVYDGSRRAAAPVLEDSAVAVPAARAAAAAGYLSETQGLGGQQLLASLHEISGRGYKSHEYKESSHYMFGIADNIASHGSRGVVDAYSGIFVPGSSAAGGDYKERGDENGDGYSDRDGMNVEHTWPQSFFGKSLPMRSDLHHLLPTFMHPNSLRGHLPFGEVQGQGEYSNNGGAKEGGGMFEPPDFSKGRVARAVLYFYTRYYDRAIFQGDYSHVFLADRIDMFLRWNREHPPTADELRRNDLVEKYQGNRNPFVDDPSLAERIGAEGFRGRTPARAQTVASETPSSEQGQQAYEYRPRHQPMRKHGRNHGRGQQLERVAALDFALN